MIRDEKVYILVLSKTPPSPKKWSYDPDQKRFSVIFSKNTAILEKIILRRIIRHLICAKKGCFIYFWCGTYPSPKNGRMTRKFWFFEVFPRTTAFCEKNSLVKNI